MGFCYFTSDWPCHLLKLMLVLRVLNCDDSRSIIMPKSCEVLEVPYKCDTEYQLSSVILNKSLNILRDHKLLCNE